MDFLRKKIPKKNSKLIQNKLLFGLKGQITQNLTGNK
jgi:hypothetical protein